MQFSSQTNIVDFLEFEPGKILMGGDRYLLLNTSAMGTLFRDLVSTLGNERAKGFMVRYGWSCGINDAYSICKKYPNAPIAFLIEQGPIIHSLEGIGESITLEFRADQENGTFYREGYWVNSYEAEQHLYHFGRSEEPVCSMMTGFASGFCSSMFGRRILYKEIECVGRGDERCRFIGKTVEEWGEECIQELSYYKEDKINEELVDAHEKIRRSNQLLKKIMNFHKRLNLMVLEGKSSQMIIDEVGQMVDSPVVLEDVHFNRLNWYLPTSEQDHVTNLQSYFLASIKGQCSGFLTSLKQIVKGKSAVSLSSIDDVSILPRTVAPIIVGQEVLGFLSVIQADLSDNEFDMMVVERAAAVLSFVALKEQTALETEHALKGEFLDELLSDKVPVELLQKRADYMGYDFDTPHRFLLINTNCGSLQTKKENQEMLTARKKVVNLVRTILNRSQKNVLIDEKSDVIIVLTDTGEDSEEFEKIIRSIQSRHKGVFPGVPFSMCVSKESRSIRQLRVVFEECQNNLNVMKRLGKKEEIIYVEKMTLFDFLYVSPSQNQLKVYAEQMLEKLLTYDENGGSQLIETLFLYLENKCNMQQTARDLNVSSSGLKYRMQRLREVGGIDLEDAKERFNIHLALNILIADGRIPLPKY